ncbi:YqeG family HAD IIIA-type phosphatase [Acetivibrio cellulolyticus]|uniref:YqeG family HAD IIIA-type phosphatase n=1 Tax=Acetivibrio cellulolyticus TaxID=35830 RepID=UPI0001E2D166|nr:YqeG family HAD IIIA-type phosphatase [Acetivibrio cellulolyticus]
MIEKFYPRLKIDKVQDIELNMLTKNKIKGLILDIDNTLVPEHVAEADKNAVEWIAKVKNAGFKVCIVSNASEKRVVKFNEKLQVNAIHKASKPGSRAFMKAARLMDIKAEETAVIGDQIFTDIFGGNRVNMFTILVKPIDKREVIYVRAKRIAEKYVLAKHEKLLSKSKR